MMCKAPAVGIGEACTDYIDCLSGACNLKGECATKCSSDSECADETQFCNNYVSTNTCETKFEVSNINFK